jgi:hypothetical protein
LSHSAKSSTEGTSYIIDFSTIKFNVSHFSILRYAEIIEFRWRCSDAFPGVYVGRFVVSLRKGGDPMSNDCMFGTYGGGAKAPGY